MAPAVTLQHAHVGCKRHGTYWQYLWPPRLGGPAICNTRPKGGLTAKKLLRGLRAIQRTLASVCDSDMHRDSHHPDPAASCGAWGIIGSMGLPSCPKLRLSRHERESTMA